VRCSTAFAFLVGRRARILVAGSGCALAIGGGVAIQLVPVLIHRLRHGALAASERSPFHSEFYGLKLTDLVLPLQSHRLGFLADVTREYAATTPLPSEGGPTLGASATIGLLALLAAALGMVLSGGSWRPRAALMRHASFAALLAFLFSPPGRMTDHDPFRLYLASTRLRWSYGASETGRPTGRAPSSIDRCTWFSRVSPPWVLRA
jgi:hypothetical protein